MLYIKNKRGGCVSKNKDRRKYKDSEEVIFKGEIYKISYSYPSMTYSIEKNGCIMIAKDNELSLAQK